MNRLILSVVLTLPLVVCGDETAPPALATGPASPPAAVTAARAELEAMLETDQSERRAIIDLEKQQGRDSSAVKEAWAKQTAVDAQNIRRLEEIIAACGWPGRTQFGDRAATAAFLVLQHADISYQKKYLPLAKAAAAKGEMPASALALLEDRIRLREGQKQLYGSQVTRNAAGEWEPLPLEDEANVDALRASVGLGPIAEYLQGFADRSGGRVSPKWTGKADREPGPPAAAAAGPPAGDPGTEREVLALQQRWGPALVHGDLAALDRLMADDWTGIGPDGAVSTKRDSLEAIRSGHYRARAFQCDDIAVRLFGDTAVVNVRSTVTATYDGFDCGGVFRFTDVWAKRGGRWQCVASHSSKLLPETTK